jgi:hypothetical protein
MDRKMECTRLLKNHTVTDHVSAVDAIFRCGNALREFGHQQKLAEAITTVVILLVQSKPAHNITETQDRHAAILTIKMMTGPILKNIFIQDELEPRVTPTPVDRFPHCLPTCLGKCMQMMRKKKRP